MTDNEVVIKVENLSKAYKLYDNPVDRLKESIHPFRKQYHRDFYALNDISFEVKKGESLGIIGKNGSGKSTLLKILTGVLTPTSGSVTVSGKVSSLLELGAGFNFEMTGLENVYFNGTVMGFSKEEMDTKIDDILAFADIGDFVHQPVKTYSSGMFVRLAFAAAISVDPDILIVDEALSVGDIFFQQKCHERMDQLIRQGTTVIVVTHNMDAVAKYSSRVMLLDKGTCNFIGRTDEAIHRFYAIDTSYVDDAYSSCEDEENRQVLGTKCAPFPDWPGDEVFLDISRAVLVGDDQIAKCTKLAICDTAGRMRKTFEMGETAIFFYEMEYLQNGDVPLGGIEILNGMNIVVASKGSLHYMIEVPTYVRKGDRIRFKQTIEMSIRPEEYTVVIAFGTMKAEYYARVASVSDQEVRYRIQHRFRIRDVAAITITERSTGFKRPFYGAVDLNGKIVCSYIPRGIAETRRMI